ncbi:MAG: MFS transporter [Desulfobacterales bacterium]|nr:MFS transporter [Desulfobacterales bacterium]MDJ0887912.1 MFS transporter [Desulfobacterales bacterium]MDJ0988513.1 MFS transporter [Desulfobacterales bacterium]
MRNVSDWRLQLTVFTLVSAAFTNIYVTQPILPLLASVFAADMVTVSLTVSAVILGMALSNLPFGIVADRWPIHPIILTGGLAVAGGGLLCAVTTSLWVLVGGRFLQGLFIPALTTCLAAYLARTLPAQRLNVVMGSYVSATVLGGLGGRLLGGGVQVYLGWRVAFVAAAAFIAGATICAVTVLPRRGIDREPSGDAIGFSTLLRNASFLRIYGSAAASFAVFSSIFNYLPFRLAQQPFGFSTQQITLLYLAYIIGVFMGPLAGRASNRLGSGVTMIGGTVLLGLSVLMLLATSVSAVAAGLMGICAGFFAIHATAIGALNRRLPGGQGRANALYVLFYYLGGWMGITITGLAYQHGGWATVIGLSLSLLLVPLISGIGEIKQG